MVRGVAVVGGMTTDRCGETTTTVGPTEVITVVAAVQVEALVAAAVEVAAAALVAVAAPVTAAARARQEA